MVTYNQAVIVKADLREHFHDQVETALGKQALASSKRQTSTSSINSCHSSTRANCSTMEKMGVI